LNVDNVFESVVDSDTGTFCPDSTPKHLSHPHTRAPIDRLILRESSASPNLVDDRAAHPICDH